MRATPSLIAATLALAALSTSASAAIVAQYSNGYVNPSPLATNATASIAAPTNVTLANSTGFYASGTFFTAARTNDSTAYFTITLSASQGQELDLTKLTFNANRGGSSIDRTVEVKSSIDSYNSSLTGGPIKVGTVRPAAGANGETWTNVAIDLGSSYQNLSSVTFRVYITTPTINQNIDFDDLKVEGSVSPVPEPAALGVLGSSAVMLVRRRAPRTK